MWFHPVSSSPNHLAVFPGKLHYKQSSPIRGDRLLAEFKKEPSMKRLFTILLTSLLVLGSFVITSSQSLWGKPTSKDCLYGKYMADAVSYGAQLQLINSNITPSYFSSRMEERLSQVRRDHSRNCRTSTHFEVPVLDNEECVATMARAEVMACSTRSAQRKDFMRPGSLYWKLVMDPLQN